jgi:1-acyl-sn-glycerol-3-phosphate acyltransferase
MRHDSSIWRSSRSIHRLGILLETSCEATARFLNRRARGPLSPEARIRWLHNSCRLVLQRLEIDVSIEGTFPSRGLLVSNHLSYIDILVFGSLAPCVFVSKKEVRRWPIYGAMARMAGTIFIDRTRRSDTSRVNCEMLESLTTGTVVVLFPEGTSSEGTDVLPFRPALFEAAVEAQEQVTPAHISYEVCDGNAATDVCYWGTMTFFPHLLRLLSKGRIRAKVSFGAEAMRFNDRKRAAVESREAVRRLAQAERMIGEPIN